MLTEGRGAPEQQEGGRKGSAASERPVPASDPCLAPGLQGGSEALFSPELTHGLGSSSWAPHQTPRPHGWAKATGEALGGDEPVVMSLQPLVGQGAASCG